MLCGRFVNDKDQLGRKYVAVVSDFLVEKLFPGTAYKETLGQEIHATVQDGILYNKAMTQLIRCPAAGGLTAYTVPASVTELAEGAFASCTSLESIVLPEGMTSIADNAFEGCSALREVTLPSTLKTLNYACFGWCSSLTNIVLPEGTEKLDWSAFASCTSLSSVTIPSSVKTIDVYAFNKCPLKEVKISKDCVLGSQAFGKDVKIKYYH